ncbi:MAG: tyrosine-type recombinase/integrase, partial [Dehalococcoidales bacterium]|nr:tyrosine-type recombinase/integrase [Dehalococcoidales bacterium]
MSKAYLEPDEIERLEQAAEYLRDRLLIRLLFHLGCRVSEALGIKAGDIDFKQGLVTIQHLKQRIKLSCPECGARLGKGHKFCPVCGQKVEKAVADEKEHRKFRVLPLDEETMKMLKDYLGRGGANSKTRLIFDLS